MSRILLKNDPQFDKIFDLMADRLNREIMIEMIRSKVDHIVLKEGSAELCFNPVDQDDKPDQQSNS